MQKKTRRSTSRLAPPSSDTKRVDQKRKKLNFLAKLIWYNFVWKENDLEDLFGMFKGQNLQLEFEKMKSEDEAKEKRKFQ